VEVICSYPIRPYTAIMMELAKLVANGELNAEFVHGEGEHAQVSVVLGASAAGARAYTGSSGVGVTYAFEVYSPAAGGRYPFLDHLGLEISCDAGEPAFHCLDRFHL
jgi:pyruvate ferredoxin oxidoreductase alpha subunit/oxalate oxidoreductase subunit alpha